MFFYLYLTIFNILCGFYVIENYFFGAFPKVVIYNIDKDVDGGKLVFLR